MIEADIRKYHRRIGILLTLFIFIQVGSGVIISLSSFVERDANAHEKTTPVVESSANSLAQDAYTIDGIPANEGNLLNIIHHDGGTIVQVIRVFVGLGIIGMAMSGTIIHMKTRKRKRKSV